MYDGQVKNTSGKAHINKISGVHIHKINIHALKSNIPLCFGSGAMNT